MRSLPLPSIGQSKPAYGRVASTGGLVDRKRRSFEIQLGFFHHRINMQVLWVLISMMPNTASSYPESLLRLT